MKIPPPNTPGARLRSLRKRAGMSQIELSVRAGFHRAHIAKAELNRQGGGRAFWEAMAGALGVPVGELLDDAKSPGGLADVQQAFTALPVGDDPSDISRVGEVAVRVEELLRELRLPTDARTLGEQLALVWHDMQALGTQLDFEDRLSLTISERRSALERVRASMLRRRAN